MVVAVTVGTVSLVTLMTVTLVPVRTVETVTVEGVVRGVTVVEGVVEGGVPVRGVTFWTAVASSSVCASLMIAMRVVEPVMMEPGGSSQQEDLEPVGVRL